MPSRPMKENDLSSGQGGPPVWQFSVLFEGATTEKEPFTLCTYVALFQFKVICHERIYKREDRCNCTEYSWSVKRRFSEFAQLDAGLRSALPDCPSLPKTTFWRQICPSEEFVKHRAGELFQYLTVALTLAQKAADASSEFLDAADLCPNLPLFLGMQEASEHEARAWAPPPAEERPVALVHSFDRGTFVFGHLEAGTQLTKHDRQAALGNLTCTHAEVRPAKLHAQRAFLKPEIGAQKKIVASPTMDPGSFCSSVWSEASSPLPSPAESRATSPRRRSGSSDESSASTVDTKKLAFELQVDEIPEVKKPPSPCVWMEVDLDTEASRCIEHRQWWAWARAQRNEEESLPMPTQVRLDTELERRRLRERYECVAALWRELSVDNEVLHTILGYGVEGRTLVVTHQMAPTFVGLRDFAFKKDRCHLLLTQAIKALAYLHEQNLAHGHLCPESFLVDDDGGQLEKRVRLMWMPGQRRIEGTRRAPATLGFKGPGDDGSAAGDLWSFGCVLLVWYFNFIPAPHPWFQFAKYPQLRQAIQKALGKRQPELPQALLDLHAAAAQADENDAHVLLVTQVCTRCLQWAPEERSSAKELQLEVADHL
ncbi:unnamed protein product [Durusdinium trenchii]|uniref:Protein kinase domain-containing protein n=1 Tax=Durusdinium trenchii TaxID=1381693 RepID=A0ABP0IYJ8_9DINO